MPPPFFLPRSMFHLDLRCCCVALILCSLLFLLLAAPSSASSASSPFTSLLHALRLSSVGDSKPTRQERDALLSIRTTPSFAPPKPVFHPPPPTTNDASLTPHNTPASSDSSSSSSPLTSTTVWAVALVLTLVGVILLFGTYLAVSM